MDKKDFLKTVSLFLQSPDDIDVQNDFVTFTIGDAEYSLCLKRGKNGELICQEDGVADSLAWNWIVNRLARLDLLAKAICERTMTVLGHYIPIPAKYDVSEFNCEVSDVAEELYNNIVKHQNFCTSVYYITAEAGEGKSVIMNYLAHKIAQDYLERKQRKLFVPIELGGRPFLRLDEVILGTLSRSYRYHACYLEGFMELIKRGVVVLGLDGFEEMAVQGAEGDVISSLGSLIRDFDSCGQVVFSTRTAYYAYTNLKSRIAFSGLQNDYEFELNEVQLKKWGSSQFIELMKNYGWSEGEAKQYRSLLGRALGEDHPVLTRAVLAHMLIREWYDSIGGNEAWDESRIIDLFNGFSAQDAVFRFVRFLIEREKTKWITQDKTPEPLLSEEEHFQLMTAIADELWRTDCDSLSHETLMDITELVCEDMGRRPDVVHQCKERIIHHVLLSPAGNRRLRFCHVDFYNFFLGVSLYNTLRGNDITWTIRKDMDRRIYPYESARECVRRIREDESCEKIIGKMRDLVKTLSRSTFINQNISELLLVQYDSCQEPIVLENLYCASRVLDHIKLQGATFKGCFFEELHAESFSGSKLQFESSEITLLKMPKGMRCLVNVEFDDESIPHLLQIETEDDVNELRIPGLIKSKLRSAGALIHGEVLREAEPDFEEDDSILLFFKVINLFNKRMSITENLLRTKLGVHYSEYESVILPVMLKYNVLKASTGRDGLPIYKLAIQMDRLNSLRARSRGSFSVLEKLLSDE